MTIADPPRAEVNLRAPEATDLKSGRFNGRPRQGTGVDESRDPGAPRHLNPVSLDQNERHEARDTIAR